ncbi:hypothetical protein MKW94_021796 [Papaver nudicaule]|uniref:Uncharacterized protein n=1 Tax=Papaver nudicaule TaxID=74823 RepID=A0AA41VQ10_PAPNU|nr:hypothetical protein [Papaver nudicaule]
MLLFVFRFPVSKVNWFTECMFKYLGIALKIIVPSIVLSICYFGPEKLHHLKVKLEGLELNNLLGHQKNG